MLLITFSNVKMTNMVGNAKKLTKVVIFGATLLVSDHIFANTDETNNHPRLEQLFESDIELFSKNAANNKVLQEIFKNRGIENPQEWLEKRMRKGGPVVFDNLFFTEFAKGRRAHELTGRIPHKKFDSQGFDRGLTEMISTILLGMTTKEFNASNHSRGRDSHWREEKRMIELLRDRLRCDKTLFESFLFDPKILEKEFNKRAGRNDAFAEFLKTFEEFSRENQFLRREAVKGMSDASSIRGSQMFSARIRRPVINLLNQLEKQSEVTK